MLKVDWFFAASAVLFAIGLVVGGVLYSQKQKDLSSAEAKIVSLQKTNATLQEQLSQLQQNGQALQKSLTQSEAKVTSLQGQLDELKRPPLTSPVIIDAYPGDGEITIEWQAPQSGGPIQGGPIQKYILTGQPDSIIQTLPGNVTKSKVTGLTNGTKYRFTVTAENSGGKTTSDLTSPIVPAPLTIWDNKEASGDITATGGNCEGRTFSIGNVKLRKHDVLEVTVEVFKDATLSLKNPDGSVIRQVPAKGIQSLRYAVESDGTYIIQVSPNFVCNPLVAPKFQYATAFVSYSVSRYALLATPTP